MGSCYSTPRMQRVCVALRAGAGKMTYKVILSRAKNLKYQGSFPADSAGQDDIPSSF